MYKNVLKIAGGMFLALFLTTFTIDATDTLSGKGGTMLAQLIGTQTAICPEGMMHMSAGTTFTCVDIYEASAQSGCVVLDPQNQFDTEINISKKDCIAGSVANTLPWRFVNREQAAIMCTRAGKRLPVAAEWYQAVLGTPKSACNIASGAASAGGNFSDCISAAGVYDGVGNVWEWVSDDVVDGTYQGRELPEAGYVGQVDSSGVATLTATEVESGYSGDYFWMNRTGAFAMVRGGFYSSKNDGGAHTVHAQTAPTLSGAAIGFRCVL